MRDNSGRHLPFPRHRCHPGHQPLSLAGVLLLFWELPRHRDCIGSGPQGRIASCRKSWRACWTTMLNSLAFLLAGLGSWFPPPCGAALRPCVARRSSGRFGSGSTASLSRSANFSEPRLDASQRQDRWSFDRVRRHCPGERLIASSPGVPLRRRLVARQSRVEMVKAGCPPSLVLCEHRFQAENSMIRCSPRELIAMKTSAAADTPDRNGSRGFLAG